MRVLIDRIIKRDEGEKLHYLFYFQVWLTYIAIVLEFITSKIGVVVLLVQCVYMFSVYRYYMQALKNYFYTFWTLSFLLGVFYLSGMLRYADDHGIIYYLYFLNLILLMIPCYILSSPVFYPRVTWWEYDFRYRGDLTIDVEVEDQTYHGRLTDLRRHAGCVLLFEKLPLRKRLKIHAKMNDSDVIYEVKIISRRERSLGRGYTYGVKFLTEGVDDAHRFKVFARYWQIHKNAKKRAKFEEQEV